MTKHSQEANGGAEFLHDLCARYPAVPRSIILKTDLLTRGLNYTDDLKAVGDDGLSDTVRGFQFHHDVVSDAESGSPAQLPWSFHFHDQTYVKVIIDLESPYAVRLGEDGRFLLYCGEQPLEEVFFPPKAGWLRRQLSDGTPITAVLFETGPCHATGIVPLDYCEYFRNGEQCRYCDWNPTFELAKAAGFRTKVAADTRQLVEAFEIAFSGPDAAACEHAHIVVAGALWDRVKEAGIYVRTLEALRATPAGRQASFLLGTQVLEPDEARRAKDAGFDWATWNLEFWNPTLFESICPGKARHVGYQRWKELLLEGVEIFGSGYLSTNFVVGPEIAIPEGFKSQDEGLASVAEGFEWCLDHGILPFYQFWRCSPGSLLADMDLPVPPTEYYVRISLAHHQLMEKYNFYQLTDPRKRATCHKCGVLYNSYDFPRLLDPLEGPRWFEW
ncbi:MAG: radical SAM protein [Candidatus Binatia bacterium]